MIYNNSLSRRIFRLLLVLLVISTTAALRAEPVQDTLESPEWFLNQNPAPSSASISDLTEEVLPRLCSKDLEGGDTHGPWKWKVDTLGSLGGHVAIDLMCAIESRDWRDTTQWRSYNAIKGIALEVSPGLFRLVYGAGTYPLGVYFMPSVIKALGGRKVLSNDNPESGSGGYHDLAAWVWDAERSVPINLQSWGEIYAGKNRNSWSPSFPGIKARPGARKGMNGSVKNAEAQYEHWPFFSTKNMGFEPPLGDRTQDSLVNVFARYYIGGRHGESRVDTIGTLHGFPFVQIAYWFHCPANCRDTIGQFVAIELSAGRFAPIYFGFATPVGSGVGEYAVLTIGEDSVIAVRGCQNYGNVFGENYWIWPEMSPAPVPLFQQWVLDETLTRIVPKYLHAGLSARIHKGKWDFKKLTYETYTWRKGEPDSSPSGGKLFIQFGLKNHRLQPIDISYDSTSVAPPSN